MTEDRPSDDAAPRRGLAAVTPGEAPTSGALLAALGGVRGIVESVLPGFVFLVVFAITKSAWLAVIAPVAVSLVFLILRAIQRGPVMSAVAGLLLVGISAVAVLVTGNANENFLPGLWINVVFATLTLVSLIARWPFVGFLYGVLTGDALGWRKDRRVRRAAAAATWLWFALFAGRLAAELPLYLAQQTEVLAIVKLVMGVPLYAGVLWITWLLLRRPKGAGASASGSSGPGNDPAPEN